MHARSQVELNNYDIQRCTHSNQEGVHSHNPLDSFGMPMESLFGIPRDPVLDP